MHGAARAAHSRAARAPGGARDESGGVDQPLSATLAGKARPGHESARPICGSPRRCLAALGAVAARAAPVLCHSDLHAQNLVVAAHGLVLLDWEYAHVSDPLWDLAGWSCNNDLGAGCQRSLLASYLGRRPGAEDASRLEHLVWLYDYVCLLWSEVFAALRPEIRR